MLQWRSLKVPRVSRENGSHVSRVVCLTVSIGTRVKYIKYLLFDNALRHDDPVLLQESLQPGLFPAVCKLESLLLRQLCLSEKALPLLARSPLLGGWGGVCS